MEYNDETNTGPDQDVGTPALAHVDREDATEELGERPGPVPSLDPSRAPQPAPEQPAAPTRTDVKEVQPAPVLTPRTVVMDATPPPTDDNTAITAPAPLGVHPLSNGGLVEAARLWYGDETKAAEIFEANRDRMSSPDTFTMGMPVRIPRLDT